ncbi:MAG: hypothetical protein LBV41_03910 [Cytophagaceae bacterium]|jgi:hypothetical protein|nr:hypothetical protein [Cytophagaceae bacterium]
MLPPYIQYYNDSLFSKKAGMMDAVRKHIVFISWRERYESDNINTIGTDFILH